MRYSVFICTYQGAEFIEAQLNSILAQCILPEKIIVSDDGSTDATLAICTHVFKAQGFEHYEIIEGPKAGVAANFLNLVMNKADSPYLFFADQDDVWRHDKAARFAEAFAQVNANEPTLIFSDSQVVDKQGVELVPSLLDYIGLSVRSLDDDSILFRNCVQGASMCINKSLAALVAESMVLSGWDGVVMHDWWIAILARYYGQVRFIGEPLIAYRQHERNHVGATLIWGRLLALITDPSRLPRLLTMRLKQFQKVLDFDSAHVRAAFSQRFSEEASFFAKTTKLQLGSISWLEVFFIRLCAMRPVDQRTIKRSTSATDVSAGDVSAKAGRCEKP